MYLDGIILKHVYKGHSMEQENVPFIGSCPLYAGWNYRHYSLMGGNEIFLYRMTCCIKVSFKAGLSVT